MVKIIGLGNMLRGDDGIGPIVVEKMRRKNWDTSLQFIDTGGEAFSILEHLVEEEPIIIIDCAQMGMQPGAIKIFKVNEKNIGFIDKSISLHGFSFGEIYHLAHKMGTVAECTVVGIEPENIDFNCEISENIQNIIPNIMNMVVEEAKKYA